MQHLRDVNPEALGVSPAEVYRAVRRLPPRLSRRSAARLLPESQEALEELFATHANVGPYRLRDVALFGIAECRRSDRFAAQLRQRKLENVGTLMRISHDGDRVVRHGRGFPAGHRPSYSDAVLDRLIRDAASEDPARKASAALWAQPGRYACSTEEIDLIVDLASAVPGVVGAQLTGAGLGGCAMVLVRGQGLRPLMSALRKGYYRPRKLPFDVHVCRPVAGSGILKV
jgi:N-acetylgalactosamine kinase